MAFLKTKLVSISNLSNELENVIREFAELDSHTDGAQSDFYLAAGEHTAKPPGFKERALELFQRDVEYDNEKTTDVLIKCIELADFWTVHHEFSSSDLFNLIYRIRHANRLISTVNHLCNNQHENHSTTNCSNDGFVEEKLRVHNDVRLTPLFRWSLKFAKLFVYATKRYIVRALEMGNELECTLDEFYVLLFEMLAENNLHRSSVLAIINQNSVTKKWLYCCLSRTIITNYWYEKPKTGERCFPKLMMKILAYGFNVKPHAMQNSKFCAAVVDFIINCAQNCQICISTLSIFNQYPFAETNASIVFKTQDHEDMLYALTHTMRSLERTRIVCELNGEYLASSTLENKQPRMLDIGRMFVRGLELLCDYDVQMENILSHDKRIEYEIFDKDCPQNSVFVEFTLPVAAECQMDWIDDSNKLNWASQEELSPIAQFSSWHILTLPTPDIEFSFAQYFTETETSILFFLGKSVWYRNTFSQLKKLLLYPLTLTVEEYEYVKELLDTLLKPNKRIICGKCNDVFKLEQLKEMCNGNRPGGKCTGPHRFYKNLSFEEYEETMFIKKLISGEILALYNSIRKII